MTFSHRTTGLKQRNKTHKGEKKRLDRIHKTGGVLKTHKKVQSKRERKAALKQKRTQKVFALKKVQSLRGSKENAIWCVILPLTPNVPAHLASLLIRKCDPNAVVAEPSSHACLQSVVQFYSPLLNKHFRLASAPTTDLFAAIDWIHLADWVILLVPSDFCGLDERTENILTALYAQGIGDVSYAVMSSSADMREIRQCLTSRFPIPEDTIHPLNTSTHAINLLRHICNPTKSSGLKQKVQYAANNVHSSTRFRAKVLADSITCSNISVPDNDESADASAADSTFLCIEGDVRGAPIFLNEPLDQPVSGGHVTFLHLTGWGDFPLTKVDWVIGGEANQWDAASGLRHDDETAAAAEGPSSNLLDIVDDALESEDDESEMEHEDDELMEIEHSDVGDQEPDEMTDTVSLSSYAARTMASSTTSAFSAAQLAKFRAARSEEMFPDEVETPIDIPARERFAKYRCLPKFYGTEWPTDKDILPAQYDQIACFRNYHRNRRSMVRYLSERQDKLDRGQCSKIGYVPPGARVCLTLGPVHRQLANLIITHHTTSSQNTTVSTPCPPLLVCSLLPHENRLSVCHFSMRRLTSALRATSDMLVVATAANKAAELALHSAMDANLGLGEEAVTQVELADESIREALSEHRKRTANVRRRVVNPKDPSVLLPPEAEPIKSKELMLFQAGMRRFISSPVYSTPTNNPHEKAKIEPFFSALQSGVVVSSLYAPVMYGPVNVLQFRIRVDEDDDGQLSSPYVAELVATGTLHSVDPGRLLIKRILLSGHPYKIHKRNAVVRFMFFNPQDVLYFKSVPLHTKSGANGHIKEAVGTHGHFKCVFDRQLQASDVVLMPLYKRVFPKCVYQPSVVNSLKLVTPPTDPSYQFFTAPITLQLTKKEKPHQDGLNEEELSLFH